MPVLRPTGDFVPFAAPPSTPAVTTTPCTTTGPPTPQFSYHDINVYALAGLAPHININVNVSDGCLQTTDGDLSLSLVAFILSIIFSFLDCFILSSLFRSRCCRPIPS